MVKVMVETTNILPSSTTYASILSRHLSVLKPGKNVTELLMKVSLVLPVDMTCSHCSCYLFANMASLTIDSTQLKLKSKNANTNGQNLAFSKSFIFGSCLFYSRL